MIKLSKKITVWITAHPFLTLLIVFIFSLTFPIFLFNCLRNLSISDQTINSSDILSYNGAIFGGLVTVVSIIYTFNYESKKSAEELRRNSLPILKLSFIKENNLFKYDLQICKNSEFKASYEKKKERVNYKPERKSVGICIYNSMCFDFCRIYNLSNECYDLFNQNDEHFLKEALYAYL